MFNLYSTNFYVELYRREESYPKGQTLYKRKESCPKGQTTRAIVLSLKILYQKNTFFYLTIYKNKL